MVRPLITVFGSLNTDLVTVTPRLPAAGETLTASSFSTGFGGKGANQAVACTRLSRSQHEHGEQNSKANGGPWVDVKMIGAVGDDLFGTDMIESLRSDGIDVSEVGGMI